jgi:hypothetical protein
MHWKLRHCSVWKELGKVIGGEDAQFRHRAKIPIIALRVAGPVREGLTLCPTRAEMSTLEEIRWCP